MHFTCTRALIDGIMLGSAGTNHLQPRWTLLSGGHWREFMSHARPARRPVSTAQHADRRESWPVRGRSRSGNRGWVVPALLGSAAALGAAALYTAKQTRDAERKHPPVGRFLEVDGVRLHYIEQGTGEPLALIHGNGTLIQDFTVNGLVDRLSERYRVIVI